MHLSVQANDLASWQDKMAKVRIAVTNKKYVQAEQLVVEAQTIAESFGQRDPRLAETINQRVTILYAQGKLADAEPFVSRQVNILTVLFGPDSPEVADCKKNYNLLLRRLGKKPVVEPPPIQTSTPALKPGERYLNFPPRGTLAPASVWAFTNLDNTRETGLGYAMGKVLVPRGKKVRISILDGTRGSTVVQLLSLFKSGDVQSLGITQSDITDDQLLELARLKGLMELEVKDCPELTEDGLRRFQTSTGCEVKKLE